MKRYVVSVIGLLMILASLISAQTLSIQGVLRDNTGASVPDATKNLTFRLYTVATGGTKAWDETQAIGIVNGVYSATLGAVNTLAGLNYSVSYWLGISVDGAEEMTPRTKLTLSPYAIAGGVAGTTNVFPQSGNVGIGTTNPKSTLHVSRGSLTAASTTFGADATAIFRGENLEMAFGTHNVSPWPLYIQGRWHTNLAQSIVINPLGGNVGIGTTNPAAALDVTGLIHARSGIKVGNAGNVITNSSGTDGRPIMSTGWTSGLGDFTAIHSGYDHDMSHEPVSVVAGSDGVQFTKATTAGSPYGETMMKVGTTDINMKLPVKIDGNKPIIFKRLVCGQNGWTNTGYSYEKYTVGVVGFSASDGDINEDNSGDIIHVYAYRGLSTKTWWIRTDFRTHLNEEEWSVHLIVVDNKLCDIIDYLAPE